MEQVESYIISVIRSQKRGCFQTSECCYTFCAIQFFIPSVFISFRFIFRPGRRSSERANIQTHQTQAINIRKWLKCNVFFFLHCVKSEPWRGIVRRNFYLIRNPTEIYSFWDLQRRKAEIKSKQNAVCESRHLKILIVTKSHRNQEMGGTSNRSKAALIHWLISGEQINHFEWRYICIFPHCKCHRFCRWKIMHDIQMKCIAFVRNIIASFGVVVRSIKWCRRADTCTFSWKQKY